MRDRRRRLGRDNSRGEVGRHQEADDHRRRAAPVGGLRVHKSGQQHREGGWDIEDVRVLQERPEVPHPARNGAGVESARHRERPEVPGSHIGPHARGGACLGSHGAECEL